MSILSRVARKNKLFGKLVWQAYRMYVNMLRVLPNTIFANYLSIIQRRGFINVSNPVTYNEKLWWLKFHYRNPLAKICSDKYRVREYLTSLGPNCAELCLPMVKHYTAVDDIKISDFSEEVILKLNIGSGANLIFNPANPITEKEIHDFFRNRMVHNYYLNSREWNFKDIEPVIVAERVLRDENGNPPVDYKFMCFWGIPDVVFVSKDSMDATGRHSVHGERFTNVYDMDWKLTQIVSSYPRRPDLVTSKPKNFEKMKNIAALLSKPFPHVRIDLYDINGKIYLGEFTFYHSGGVGNISPREEAVRLGDLIDISSIPTEHIV